MPKTVYILSGQGADERVFQKLDLSGYAVTYLKWIDPLDIASGPYTYDVLRATGKVSNKNLFVPVATGLTTPLFDDSGEAPEPKHIRYKKLALDIGLPCLVVILLFVFIAIQ